MQNRSLVSEIMAVYIRAEDRILLKITCSSNASYLWVTRAIAKKIISKVTENTTSLRASTTSLNRQFMQNRFERDIAESRVPLIKRSEGINELPPINNQLIGRLVENIAISKVEDNKKNFEYQIKFFNKSSENIVIKLSKDQLLNFQTSILRKVNLAKW